MNEIIDDRRAFECWFTENGRRKKRAERGFGGRYRLAVANENWNVWKEACADAQRREVERCYRMLCATRDEISLAVGDMTAQEWRTVAAVLGFMQRRVWRYP